MFFDDCDTLEQFADRIREVFDIASDSTFYMIASSQGIIISDPPDQRYCLSDRGLQEVYFEARDKAEELLKKPPEIKTEYALGLRMILERCEDEQKVIDKPTEAKVGNDTKTIKAPSKEAIQAYMAKIATGYTQTKLAKEMTKLLKPKPKKPIEQWQVHRWIKDCVKWLKANNLDVFPDEITKDIITMDPSILDMGARTDGRTTGDPRHKKLDDPDSDIYD